MSGASQACAACKYQRRKCAPNCLLAPFFPPDAQRHFLNAHRLFGVSNIQKIVKNLDPEQREIAMRSIIFQSNMRAADPIGGCYRVILELQRQIALATAELEFVQQQLAMCREQLVQNQMMAMANGTTHLNNENVESNVPLSLQYNDETRGGGERRRLEKLEYEAAECNGKSENDSPVKREAISPAQIPNDPLKNCAAYADDSEDIKPLLAIFEDKHMIDPLQCSEKIDLEQPQNLKGAASLFSLTNFNG